MALNGFDISAYQNGINLSAVPFDFMIRKTSEGTYHINPGADDHIQQAISLGKLWGFYHYVAGSPDPVTEADFWIDNTANYWGKGLPCIDWERTGNAQFGNTGYLRDFAQHVIDRTGIKPMIYASSSEFPWDVAQSLDCGTWVAQYASMEPTYGYQQSPWNEGAYPCAIRQYSSTGYLNGYGGPLDIDKFYGEADTWMAYVTGGNGGAVDIQSSTPASASAPAPASSGQTYTVQSGDTLSGIASAYGTSWQHLADINGLADPNVIYPGQVLKIG